MSNSISIFEYDKLCATSGLNGTRSISPETFNDLELFLADLNQYDEEAGGEMHEAFRLSSHRGHKVLQARNYVGVISAGETTIEILPKIGRLQDDVAQARSTFLAMLSELRETPFKNLGQAPLRTQKMTILEVFISLFLDEVQQVTKRGICSDYLDWADNERFVKGRINFSEHVRRNYADQSRVFVEYSLYHVDRPENRLLKSGLRAVARQSGNAESRRRIKIALDHLAEVNESSSPYLDFAACKNDRNLAHYANALNWCRIFLAGEAPTSFPGMVTTDSLLFPMERIFEDYVAAQLQREAPKHGLSVSTQEQRRCLFDAPRQYPLRPDIVIRPKGAKPVILDTKWKIPPDSKPAQSDMYQMFVYAAKYDADHVILIYPAKGDQSRQVATYRSELEDRAITIHAFEYALPVGLSPNKRNNDGCRELLKFIKSITKPTNGAA